MQKQDVSKIVCMDISENWTGSAFLVSDGCLFPADQGDISEKSPS